MKWLAIFCAALLLASCAGSSTRPAESVLQAAWVDHQAQLQAIQNWQLSGKILIDAPDETWNARVLWQQQGVGYQMRFNAPLGQGAMLLEGQPGRVSIRTSDNRVAQASTPEQLLREMVNINLPVRGLYFWIRGLASPHSPITQSRLNNSGYLESLQQAGWKITFDDYRLVNQVQIPHRIFLQNTSYRVRMAVSSWLVTGTMRVELVGGV